MLLLHRQILELTHLYLNQRGITPPASLSPNIGSALLLLEYQMRDDSLQYHINFLSPAFSDNYIEQLGQDFERIILSVIKNVDIPLTKYPV